MDRAYDEERRGFWEGTETPAVTAEEDIPNEHDTNPERMAVRSTLLELGHLAADTLADSYETEQRGVLFGASLDRVPTERTLFMRSLAEAASLAEQLEEKLAEIERSIASLQDMIDPENH